MQRVTLDDVVWSGLPDRYEAGSPNVIGAVALGAACDVLAGYGMDVLAAEERPLVARLRAGLRAIPGVLLLDAWADERVDRRRRLDVHRQRPGSPARGGRARRGACDLGAERRVLRPSPGRAPARALARTSRRPTCRPTGPPEPCGSASGSGSARPRSTRSWPPSARSRATDRACSTRSTPRRGSSHRSTTPRPWPELGVRLSGARPGQRRPLPLTAGSDQAAGTPRPAGRTRDVAPPSAARPRAPDARGVRRRPRRMPPASCAPTTTW